MKNFRFSDLIPEHIYSVDTVDHDDLTTEHRIMTGEDLKSFANAALHLYDIYAEDITADPEERPQEAAEDVETETNTEIKADEENAAEGTEKERNTMENEVMIWNARNNIYRATTERIRERKTRSAWDHGVKWYALELSQWIEDNTDWIGEDPIRPEKLEEVMLNGASDWKQYSWGGFAELFDEDIAERLCTPSELERTRHGKRRPNKREEWLDVQARALCQAALIVEHEYKALYSMI